MINIAKKKLDGLTEITLHTFEDDRGFSARIFDDRDFQKAGFPTRWTEITRQYSNKKNIVRGLYVQPDPYGEGKLLSATRGEVLWVSVDVRKGSKTFGEWDSTVLSGTRKNLLLASRGFAHGCNSLTDDAEILIMSDSYFAAEHGVGILWNDGELNIDWQLHGATPFVSEAHQKYPSFADFRKKYGGGA